MITSTPLMGLLAATGLILVLVACGGERLHTIDSAIEVSESESMPCEAAPVVPPSDFTVVAGAAALPAAPLYGSALQADRRIGEDGAEYYFAKTGLWVRSGVDVRVSVAEAHRDFAAIGWHPNGATPSREVVVECALGEWVGAPGGYYTVQPLCLELLVEVGGESEAVNVGVGEPCPGQQPPIS